MKQYPGYTLVKHEDCPEQHGTLTVLTHDVSGAAVLLVENDDDNKAFGIRSEERRVGKECRSRWSPYH